MPVVSIIIPFHNREAELPQTLASVAAQTFGDYEAVIVNDRSHEALAALPLRWSKRTLDLS
jgi:glycosyltransferase involved in cell wall biosynthesis